MCWFYIISSSAAEALREHSSCRLQTVHDGSSQRRYRAQGRLRTSDNVLRSKTAPRLLSWHLKEVSVKLHAYNTRRKSVQYDSTPDVRGSKKQGQQHLYFCVLRYSISCRHERDVALSGSSYLATLAESASLRNGKRNELYTGARGGK